MATAQNTRTAPTQASRRQGQAGADPIFGAIAALDRATTKAETAEAAYEKAQKAYDAACRKIGLVKYRGEYVRSIGRFEVVAGVAGIGMPVFGKEARIERLLESPGRARSDYLRARAQLEERVGAFEEAERDSRVKTLEKALSRAWSAQWEAERAVIEMEPTTGAGAMAQLRVLATAIEGNPDYSFEAPDVIRFALALIEAPAR
ncbi:MAG: hypothetical protein U1E20_06280 [Methylocystis sp.]|uniref:hypothetical protein n=1 Tax=Methylocystis sp. TaxID=1911079 RepID=UPI00392E9A4B